MGGVICLINENRQTSFFSLTTLLWKLFTTH